MNARISKKLAIVEIVFIEIAIVYGRGRETFWLDVITLVCLYSGGKKKICHLDTIQIHSLN